MKLRFSDPVVVSMGPDSRTAGWGPYQFPNLFVLDDGRLVYTFNVGADSETAYGSEPGCYVSADGGRTWSPRREKDFSGKLGVKLPNGDRLAPYCGPSIPLDGLKLPEAHRQHLARPYDLLGGRNRLLRNHVVVHPRECGIP